MRRASLYILLVWLAAVPNVFAEESAPEKSQKQVDFEDETIEGVNRQPLDSLSQTSDQDEGRGPSHLYRKSDSIKDEIDESIRGLVETY